MPIYSYQGSSIQIIDEPSRPRKPSPLPLYDSDGNRAGESPPIEMNGQHPSPAHIASDTGEWILPEPQAEVTANETDNPENAS